ncbi:MAG: alkaline phosphatase [Colwellia sp.]
MKKLLSAIFVTVALGACATTAQNNLTASDTAKTTAIAFSAPKNIIMVVGDGMGPAYITAYRYFKDNPATKTIEQTVFDRTLVGIASTYPARVSGYVTDSAASATALATGIKSYNGAIGVDVDKNPVETVLEWAKKQGMKTGVVVTSQVNHATPASYLAHNESRKNYNAIADSYLDDGIKADIILGGGWQYFIRDDRNLVNEFKAAGFHYLDTPKTLNNLPPQTQVLGLFADVGLPWALDDANKLRLSAMTKAAVKQLDSYQVSQDQASTEQGYFLLVEASQIDWAGHANDIAAAMAEMDDLAKTLEYLEEYVKNNPDTLVIVTADHSTGGFTVAANGLYEWDPTILRKMKHSPQKIAKQLVKTEISIKSASERLNFNVTAEEVILLQQAKNQTIAELASFNHLNKAEQKKTSKPRVSKSIYGAIKQIIDTRTNTGWTSDGHTAIDVPVFAFGKSSTMFKGQMDNTDIAKKIFILLGK